MSQEIKPSLWERWFGRVLAGFMVLTALLITLHVWQESMGEDGATVWSCHTMGNRMCGPDRPWHGISIRWGRP